MNAGRAGAAASDADGLSGLLGLHQALQRADFVGGPRELLAATQLLVRLREAGRWSDDLVRLKPLLSAVYCKSRQEQDRFAAVYDAWQLSRPDSATDSAPVAQAAAGALPALPQAPSPWRGRLVGSVVALIVLVALVLAWRQQAAVLAPPAPASVVQPAPDQALTEGPAGPGKPVAMPGVEPAAPDGGVGLEPQQVLQREFRPWVVALLLALPLPLLLLFYAPALALSRRHVDRQRQGAGVQLDVSAWRSEAERVVPLMNLDTAARLDRHMRPHADDNGPGARRELDPARTLAATLRRHGQLALRWRPRRTRPSYLVLIDVRDENDLRGRLFFRWSDRLRREGVNVDIWLFDGDPRVLYPAHQRRVRDADGADRNAVRFEQVAQRALADSVHRLVVVSDGGGFVDAQAQWQPWWPLLGWERWAERVMFTPVDSRDWGDREVAIERPLGRGDPGFLVLPLEAEALDAYAVHLTQGELPAIVLSAARRFPSLLERLPQGGLAAQPPPPADVEKLIAQLRLYLGENGLRWLAACAVPPVSRWELTLLIGQDLFRDMGALGEDELRWLMQTNYARLARLPWLRHASFPDWLALRLLGELAEPVQQRIRRVVRTLLDQVPADEAAAARDVLSLDCTPPGGGAALAGAGDGAPPDEAQRRRQWLYLGFLDGLTPRQLALRAPLSWRQWLSGSGAPLRTAGEWWRHGLDWLRAWAARLMWRDGRAESGASLLPLGLSLVWLVGCVLVLQRLAGMAQGDLAPTLAQNLFVDTRSDAGAVSEVAFTHLAFSADGKRFATLDASGEVQVRNNDARADPVGRPMQLDAAVVAIFLQNGGERLIAVDPNTGLWSCRVGLDDRCGNLGISDWRFSGSKASDVGAAYDSRRNWLAVWKSGGTLSTFDVSSPTTGVKAVTFDIGDLNPNLQASFDSEGNLVRLGGGQRAVYDPRTGQQLEANTMESTLRHWLSPDGASIVEGSDAGGVSLWSQVANRPSRLLLDTGTVEGVAFGPDGRVAITDKLWVSAWNAQGPLGRLAHPASQVDGAAPVAWAAGGRLLLVPTAGYQVGTFKVAADAAERLSVPGQPASAAHALLPLPQGLGLGGAPRLIQAQGDSVITTDANHELRLWRDARLMPLPPPAPIASASAVGESAVAITRDGRWAAAGDAQGRIRVWDPRSGHPRSSGVVVGGAVKALQWAADGQRLLILSADDRLRVWDAAAARLLYGLSDAALAGARWTASAGASRILLWSGGEARLWRLEEDALRGGAQVQTADIAAADVSDDGEQFLTARADGQITVWSSATGGRVAVLSTRGNSAAAPGAKAAASVVTLPAVTGQAMRQARDSLSALGLALQVSGFAGATRALPGTVVTMSPGAGASVPVGATVQLLVAGSSCREGFVERQAFAGDTACVEPTTRAQVASDNAAAAARVAAKNLTFGAETCAQGYVWREADRAQRGEKFTDKVCVALRVRQQAADDNASQRARQADGFGFQPARKAVLAPAPAPAVQERLQGATFARDRVGSLLVLSRGTTQARAYLLNPPPGPIGPVVSHPGLSALAYWPQGDMVLTGGRDGRVRFWKLVTGEEVLPSLRHGAALAQLTVAPDGRHLVSADTGGRLRVWDLIARRALPPTVGAAASAVAAVAFDAAGEQLVSAAAGGAVQVHRLPSYKQGELRVVRPYAPFWLVALVLVVVSGMVGVALTVRRRSGWLARLAQSTHAGGSDGASSPA